MVLRLLLHILDKCIASASRGRKRRQSLTFSKIPEQGKMSLSKGGKGVQRVNIPIVLGGIYSPPTAIIMDTQVL